MWPFTPWTKVPVSSSEEADEAARQVVAQVEAAQKKGLATRAKALKAWGRIPSFAELPCPACGSERNKAHIADLWKPYRHSLYTLEDIIPADDLIHKFLLWTCTACKAQWSTKTKYPITLTDGAWNWDRSSAGEKGAT